MNFCASPTEYGEGNTSLRFSATFSLSAISAMANLSLRLNFRMVTTPSVNLSGVVFMICSLLIRSIKVLI